MRNLSILVASLAVFSFACGGYGADPSTLDTQRNALYPIGSGCSSDSQCDSGLCFDTYDAYPDYTPWEHGTVCTVECDPDNGGDAYCQDLAGEYNAPHPERAECRWARAVYDNGPDEMYYICDLIKAGLGSYWSE